MEKDRKYCAMCYYYNAEGEDEICTFTTTGKFLAKPNESACEHWTLCTYGALCWKDVKRLVEIADKHILELKKQGVKELDEEQYYEEVIRLFNKL